MTFLWRKSVDGYQQHLRILATKTTEFSEITQHNGLLRRSWLFKVTDFGTNLNPIPHMPLPISD